MRVRVAEKVGREIERLARAESRTVANMVTRLVVRGMVSEGLAASTTPVPVDDVVKDSKHVNLPLPASMLTTIKRLAKADDRSNRSMMRQILHTGIQTYQVNEDASL